MSYLPVGELKFATGEFPKAFIVLVQQDVAGMMVTDMSL